MRGFQHVIYLGPALAANHTVVWKANIDMQITHVSMVNTSANAGTLKIGTSADDDIFLAATDFGVSSTPVEVSRTGFIGSQYPRIARGDIVIVTITDHASHMAGVSVVISYQRG